MKVMLILAAVVDPALALAATIVALIAGFAPLRRNHAAASGVSIAWSAQIGAALLIPSILTEP